jgi:hypothetical protein
MEFVHGMKSDMAKAADAKEGLPQQGGKISNRNLPDISRISPGYLPENHHQIRE